MAYPDTVQDIVDWDYSNSVLEVTAYLPDWVLLHNQTLLDPAEFGPGLAQVSLELDEDLDSPPPSSISSSDEVLELLMEYDPISWQPADAD